MTIDEKLQHFYDVTVQEVQADAERELEESRANLEEMLKKHKKSRRLSAEGEIRAASENARHEINKALSAQQLTIKRHWNQKQNALKEELFGEVKNLLTDFAKTPEYQEYLCRKIEEAKTFAGEDKMKIYLAPADEALILPLSQKTGVSLLLSTEDFIGGIRAVIPGKNILIDNSFLEGLRSMSREFTFGGGQQHE